jgi:iron complex outermembrane receptor protein
MGRTHVSYYLSFALGSFLALGSHSVNAADELSIDQLKTLSITELSSLEVGIASKIPTEVNKTPAAVFVLTSEDIRRAGAFNVPEALRMVPGLNVGAVSGNSWAVNSRGFNETFANKFLVLLDGRSLYSATFGGVYWDMQNVRIEDIDRIEVIRGPGSAVWGANAMNGVINIITKSTYSTQGGELVTSIGNKRKEVNMRYGGEMSLSSSYRVSAKTVKTQENTATNNSGLFPFGPVANDDADHSRVSFRSDTDFGNGESLIVDSALFKGRSDQRLFLVEGNPVLPPAGLVSGTLSYLIGTVGLTPQQAAGTLVLPTPGNPWDCLTIVCLKDVRDEQKYEGGHALLRWRQVSDTEWKTLQAYIDYTQREDYQIDQTATALDLDYEQGFKYDGGQVAWGVGFRTVGDSIDANLSPSEVVTFSPDSQRNNILNTFLQNEIDLTDDASLLLGLGYEYSSIYGSQWQPSIRGIVSLNEQTQVWGAVSYSSRVPSRVETSVVSDSAYLAQGNPDILAEKLTSAEVGIRYSPTDSLMFDLAAFRYRYDDLASVRIERFFNPVANLPGIVSFHNDAAGDAYGAEIAVRWVVSPAWTINASYSWLDQSMDAMPALVESTISQNKSPEHQFVLRSSWDITDAVELDLGLYYVSELGNTGSLLLSTDYTIKDYIRTDVRVGWQISPDVELSLIGQGLFDNQHQEFFSSPVNVGGVSENTEIDRSVTAKLTVRF